MRTAAFGLLVLLLLAGWAGAEEKLVTMDFVDTHLTKVATWLKQTCEVEIEVSPGLSRAKVTLKVEDAELSDVLETLAKLAAKDGEAVELDPGYWRLRRKGEDDPPEVRIARALDETRVNLNFADTRLDDALNFLGQYGEIVISIDPDVKRQKSEDELLVTLRADDLTLRNALDLITLTKTLAYEVRWGVVFVSSEERIKDLPKTVLPVASKDAPRWELALRKRLAEPIAFSFDGATLDQALEFLRALKGLNVVFTPDARAPAAGTDLSLSVSNTSVENALALMLVPRGFTFELKEGVVLVSKK